jgi:hypothetical protein
MIFVPYDGLQRGSEIEIESINLWICIYDIPAIMMIDGFARALGGKVGRVLEIGEAHSNYKRVKVEFPLDRAILPKIQQKVKGYGVMEFMVKYENIPHFCFSCGRIGHAQQDCPDDDGGGEGDVQFGKVLQCSPQKRGIGRRMVIPAAPTAKRGLNFSGEQRRRVLSRNFSSNASPRSARSVSRGGRDAEDGEENSSMRDIGEEVEGGGENSAEVEKALAKDVAKMAVDDLVKGVQEKVSGMDSYMGSSEKTEIANHSKAIACDVGMDGGPNGGPMRERGQEN